MKILRKHKTNMLGKTKNNHIKKNQQKKQLFTGFLYNGFREKILEISLCILLV